MKQPRLILFVLFLSVIVVPGVKSQRLALKTNTLSWLTTTVNAGVEYKLGHRLTSEMDIMYKPWKLLPDNKKMTGLLMQAGMKYWLCQAYYRHAVGINAHYGQYNGGFGTYRYQGALYGAGFTYAYQWVLNKKLNIELAAGLGYAHMKYDKYYRPKCGYFLGKEGSNYWGITKLSVSVVYFIR